jgi:methanogenic corrinoid protein MtbC1
MKDSGLFTASLICASAKALAAGIVERQAARQPDVERYGRGATTLRADTEVRLGYLAEAIAAERPALFGEQLGWLKVLCTARDVPLEYVRVNIECMRLELVDRLPADSGRLVMTAIDAGLAAFDAAPTEVPSYLAEDAPLIDLARRFLLAVLEAREADALALVTQAMDAGSDVHELQEHVLRKVQYEIGRMWQMAEVTVAEEHYCTGIVSTAATVMRLRSVRRASNGRRVIAASVSAESHDVGIRCVTTELEIDGWSVLNLGPDTPASAIIEAVRDFGCDLIALSTSMMLYIRQAADTIAAVRAEPLTAGIPILVGGHPFNVVSDLWRVVGADACAASAAEVTEVAARLVKVDAG